jgi:hypothetical protein
MTKRKKDNAIDGIRMAVGELLDKGTHIDASKAAAFIGRKLGLNERLVNYAHIEIRNKLNELKFRKTKYRERVLFLPHCLRDSEKCHAKYGDDGLICGKCGRCKICTLAEIAAKYKYRGVFVTPGGSMVYKIMQKLKPKAIIGVACYHEAMIGLDKAAEFGIPAQVVVLARDGCKDTDVNLEEAEEKIALKG